MSNWTCVVANDAIFNESFFSFHHSQNSVDFICDDVDKYHAAREKVREKVDYFKHGQCTRFYWSMNGINFSIIAAPRLGISNKCIGLYLHWFLQILLEKAFYGKDGKVYSDENNFQVKRLSKLVV